jgi:hypothetical protein
LSIDIDLGKSDARAVSDFLILTVVLGRSFAKLGTSLLATVSDVIDVDIFAWFLAEVVPLLMANEILFSWLEAVVAVVVIVEGAFVFTVVWFVLPAVVEVTPALVVVSIFESLFR